MKIIEKLLKVFEQDYLTEKKKSSEELHSAFQQIIDEQQPDIFILLYVLRLIEFEVLKQDYDKLFKDK